MSPLRLLLVDDHALFREGLTSLLSYQDDFTVSLRRGPWKMIRVHNEGLLRELEEPYQLYNVEEDPLETRNLFAERQEVVAKLKAVLDAEVARRHATEGVAQILLNPTEEDVEQLRQLGYVQEAADLEKRMADEPEGK